MRAFDERFDPSKPVQVRCNDGGLMYFDTLSDAIDQARQDENIEKISFKGPYGEIVRLVTYNGEDWIYESILEE